MASTLATSTAESLAFRANLARLISPLRRVRPRVPFYQLKAHRIPTLWSLYRGLLSQAPSDDIKFRIRMLFRKNQHLTGTEATRKHLLTGYKWLDIFTKANEGDTRLHAILVRYSRAIATKREKEYWKQLVRDELAWQHKIATRPILTGAYHRGSILNRPLPRLKPQPLHISSLIHNRRRAKEHRTEKLKWVNESLEHLKREREFEGMASIWRQGVRHKKAGNNVVYSSDEEWKSWSAPLYEYKQDMYLATERGEARAGHLISPELKAAIKAARREKGANKARERARERAGEILPRTLKRQRKGPPPHELALMSPEKRARDRVVRSISEVGYVAMMKMKMGFRFKDWGKWKLENGTGEKDKEAVLRMMREVEEEDKRRSEKYGERL